MSIFRNLGASLHAVRRDRRGAIAVIFALTSVATVGMTAFVIDTGRLFVAQRELQAATDAAALAGAAAISSGNAMPTALSYSAVSGGENDDGQFSVSLANGYPAFKCLKGTGVPCDGKDKANAIVVRQEATIPMYFAGILGIRSLDIAATATAAMNAGVSKSYDTILLLDVSGSMNNLDAACALAGASRLQCAKAGALTLLKSLSTSTNTVGLMTFPGATSAAEAAKAYDCKPTTPQPARYKDKPNYEVLTLAGDFGIKDVTKIGGGGGNDDDDDDDDDNDDDDGGNGNGADGTQTLNPESDLVKAFDGVGGCTGMTSVGGVGTYFAQALRDAQAALVKNGRTKTQRVIILLSDGDAGAQSASVGTVLFKNQCKQAVDAAKSIAADGTWIYSIAYGAPPSKNASCPTDKPRISGCETMRDIASDAGKFYSDKAPFGSACAQATTTTELIAIFKAIAASYKGARLVSDTMI